MKKKAGTEGSLAEGQEAVLFGFEGAREKPSDTHL